MSLVLPEWAAAPYPSAADFRGLPLTKEICTMTFPEGIFAMVFTEGVFTKASSKRIFTMKAAKSAGKGCKNRCLKKAGELNLGTTMRGPSLRNGKIIGLITQN
jgi:hypothetical protein